jgi:sugar O-acyltransferase (sialic acid O-acetyltransferase NeuD family)
MIVYGASGHGKVIIDILESIGEPVITVWDDADKAAVWDYEVGRPFPDGMQISDKMIISIGRNATRKKVAERLGSAVIFGKAIHATAHITKRVTIIGEGTVVMAGVIVNPDVRIGKHCIINTSASIDHDCVIGDYAHISPNVTLSGDVHIGEGTHVGSGASVIQGIKIGKWCTVGAGAVVIIDIPDYATAVGNPARIIKEAAE